MRRFLRTLFASRNSHHAHLGQINQIRTKAAQLSDEELRGQARASNDRLETLALAAEACRRILGMTMFDVQLLGALALTDGRVIEMLTGEGKTMAAVPAVVWFAKAGKGVHVLTVNDYLARRDAQWMGPVYEFFGFSVGYIGREMTAGDRQQAYKRSITYATANEVGFDYLRDQLALRVEDQVHQPFAAAVIDEADSILLDEARIPLVIAGGVEDQDALPHYADQLTRHFRRGVDYVLDEYGRNVILTDHGIRRVESAFRCGNLFDDRSLALHTAVQESVHAHALLRRDVDYLVKDGAIVSIDEFKGRVIQDRRWPAGLHTALEAKEGLNLNKQGRILGSITLENLVAIYPRVCGMTGTAATQKEDFRTMYGMQVAVIPPNRPVIRMDYPDVVFPNKQQKEEAVIEEIRQTHETRRPVLVGTTSVEESERLSRRMHERGISHQVLNARHEEQEAAIVARAGEAGAVTISTNMAGRGTDIKLGDGVAQLGGLYVIGTNRHENRRIDNQLRGRAGRQGDPGSSRFFISREDDLLVRFGINDPNFTHDPDSIQRVVEGQNLDIRQMLRKYEAVIEGQRMLMREKRQKILDGTTPCASELERLVRLTTIDDLWSEYLANVAELRSGIHWVSWAARDPLHEYLVGVDDMFLQLEQHIADESAKRLSEAKAGGFDLTQRGATWTYLTTDRPFGAMSERIIRGLLQKMNIEPVTKEPL